jgi:4-hydroxy-tetrahydrodipicolinate synthase
MPRHKSYLPHGVIPAALLPFNEDLSIDEGSFRSHLRDIAAVPGISAVTINAHATEVAASASTSSSASWPLPRTKSARVCPS